MSHHTMTRRTAAATLALAACLTGAASIASSAHAAPTPALREDTYTGPSLILASGDDRHQVDSLTVGPFAATLAAPILLTPTESLSATAHDRITATAVCTSGTVWVVGGPAAVSPVVEAAVRTDCPHAQVVRLAGQTRYETAVADAYAALLAAIADTGPTASATPRVTTSP